MKHSLMGWRRQRHRLHPEERLTRVGNLTRRMLGDPSDTQLKTKGADTWDVLLFTAATLAANQDRLPAAASRLLEAARACIGMVDVVSRTGGHMPPVATRSSRELYERRLALTDVMPELAVPKRHIVMRMIETMPVFGNPRLGPICWAKR